MFTQYILASLLPLLGIFACQSTNSQRSLVSLGNQYAKDGLLREAANSYKRALTKNGKNPTAHRNLGMVLVKLGNYKAATSHLEKAITHYATDFDTNFYLGEAHRGLDKYSEAIFRYKVALSVQPDAPKALKPLAWSYFKIRYYSEALLSARRLHKIAPKDSQAPIILSRTLLKLKRPNEAITLLKKAKAHVAANTLPYYQSVEGDLLYEKGDLDGAMKAYRAALKDRPLLAGALLGLGRCLYDKGKTKKALTFMQRAVRIQPRLTEAYYLLGRALEKTDRQKSLRYYRIFRRQASADPEFLGLIDEVKKKVGLLQKRTKSRQ